MGETAESFSAPRDDISLRIFGCFQGTDLMGSVHWWIKQANGQRDTRGVIFLWRRGARTIRLIFGHPHIWSVTKVLGSCQKKVLLPCYLEQMDISDCSESTTATLENDEQSWYKDTLDWWNIWIATRDRWEPKPFHYSDLYKVCLFCQLCRYDQ